MGDKITLKVDPREAMGKKVSKLRAAGITPAIVYGAGMESMPVQADSAEVRKVVQQAGKHTPVVLTGAKRRIAMIRDIAYNPTKAGAIRHVSFYAVKADEPVETEVPVRLIGEGESEAERAGLVVLQSLEKVQVRALPMDLPEAIEINITGLKEAGEKITLAAAALEDGVEFVEKAYAEAEDDEDEERPTITDLVVASVYEPSALAAANEAAAGDAEPGDEANVEAEQGEDTDQGGEVDETRPGGKGQDEPKQSNVDAS